MILAQINFPRTLFHLQELTECQIRLDSAKREQANIQQDAANEQAHLRTQLADVQKQLNKAMTDLKRTERLLEREADERRIHVSIYNITRYIIP